MRNIVVALYSFILFVVPKDTKGVILVAVLLTIDMDKARFQRDLNDPSTDPKHDDEPVADGSEDMGCFKSKGEKYVLNDNIPMEDINADHVEGERTEGKRTDSEAHCSTEIQKSPDGSDGAKETEESSEVVHLSPDKQKSSDDKNHALQKLRLVQTNDDDDDDDEDLYNQAYEKYEYFWQSKSIYSQWHKSDFYVDGIKFCCAEQYMMYGKAKVFDDDETAKLILKNSNPRKIKELGRAVHGFVDEIWKYECLDIVKRGNIAKFSKNPKLQKELVKTFPKVLVEASPYDRIWGIGLEETDPWAWQESKWQGTNLLGYILTEVRNDLMIQKHGLAETYRMKFVEKEKEKHLEAYENMKEFLYSSTSPDDNSKQKQNSIKNNGKNESTLNKSKQSNPEHDIKDNNTFEKNHSPNVNNQASSKRFKQDVDVDAKTSEKAASNSNSNEECNTKEQLGKGDEGSDKLKQSDKHGDSKQMDQESPQSGKGKNRKKNKKRKGEMNDPEAGSTSSHESGAKTRDEMNESKDFEPHIPESKVDEKKRKPEKQNQDGAGAGKLSRRQKKNANRHKTNNRN